MFLGGHANTMDDKGRVNIPAAFREVLRRHYDDERLYITLDIYDPCLRAYPVQEWQQLLEKLRQQPSTNRTVRQITRKVVSSAFEYTPDKQGRVLLAPLLREYAGLSKGIHFAGTNNTFEIWDTERWQQETQLSVEDGFDEKLLDELGI